MESQFIKVFIFVASIKIVLSGSIVTVKMKNSSASTLVNLNDTSIDKSFISSIWNLMDPAESSIQTLWFKDVVEDMAASKDPFLQMLALAETFGVIPEMTWSVPGTHCDVFANIIDQSVLLAKGKSNGKILEDAFRDYVRLQEIGMQNFMKLGQECRKVPRWPPRGFYADEDRVYSFEESWNILLSAVDSKILQENYCSASRLYKSCDRRSNNIAAAATAAASAPCWELLDGCRQELVRFLKVAVKTQREECLEYDGYSEELENAASDLQKKFSSESEKVIKMMRGLQNRKLKNPKKFK